MPTEIRREEVQRLLDEGAQLVDALPAPQYEKSHLMGAVNKQKHLVADLARQGVPTCALQEKIGAAQERSEQAGWDLCVVVNDKMVVLGALPEDTLKADAQKTAEESMDAGIKTYRPNTLVETTSEYMRKHEQPYVLVTKSNGKLIGALLRTDVEKALQET